MSRSLSLGHFQASLTPSPANSACSGSEITQSQLLSLIVSLRSELSAANKRVERLESHIQEMERRRSRSISHSGSSSVSASANSSAPQSPAPGYGQMAPLVTARRVSLGSPEPIDEEPHSAKLQGRRHSRSNSLPFGLLSQTQANADTQPSMSPVINSRPLTRRGSLTGSPVPPGGHSGENSPGLASRRLHSRRNSNVTVDEYFKDMAVTELCNASLPNMLADYTDEQLIHLPRDSLERLFDHYETRGRGYFKLNQSGFLTLSWHLIQRILSDFERQYRSQVPKASEKQVQEAIQKEREYLLPADSHSVSLKAGTPERERSDLLVMSKLLMGKLDFNRDHRVTKEEFCMMANKAFKEVLERKEIKQASCSIM